MRTLVPRPRSGARPMPSLRMRLGVGVMAALLALPLLPAPADAQYFGRNKVQYEDFDMQVLRTSHFDIHYYPVEAEAVQDAARMSERWYERLSGVLDHEFGRKPVILYANHPDFQQTNVIGGFISEGTGGVTEGLKSRLVMPFTGTYGGTDHVLGHEMVHVFQYDIAGGGMTGIQGLSRLPLWSIEGMAEYLSVGRVDAHTAMWLRDALLRDDLPTLDQLTRDPRFFPYRFGQAFWAWVGGTFGDEMVNELFRGALEVGLDEAMVSLLGMTEDTVSERWKADIRRDYAPAMEGRAAPRDVGARVLAEDVDAGEMNISPVLSPDGRHVIFLSELDLFSIDLFLADAETGRVIRKVASSQSNAHIDALSFLESAGTWSPDGQQFAFVVIAEGDNQLAIADVRDGKIRRRLPVPGVEGMRDPAWSPDGSQIAVTGIVGGRSDLYLVDVATGTPRQLTNDAYAELHPSWSPDGRTLVFSTDRGPGTDLETLAFGPLRLATMEAAGGPVRLLDVFDGPKHIDPQFGPDGSLYFISDRGGFSDVYRLEPQSGEVFQVTNIATGVSGITAEAPALSVAAHTGRMMFSVFEEGNYAVHRLEAGETVGTRVPATGERVALPAVLPPVEALGRGTVASYLDNPVAGLPPERFATAAASADPQGGWTVSDYDPDLGLLYLGTPQVGVASNQYGTSLGGAISGYFGDLLGDRELYTAVAVNGGLKDAGGQAVYFDRDQRWNWGGALAHIPYLSMSPVRVFDGNTPINPGGVQPGDTVTLVQQLQRVFVQQAQGMAQYPFSQTRRFEVQGGFTRYAFDLEERRQRVLVGSRGTQLLDESTQGVDLGDDFPSLNLFESSAALVGDNSFFGFTSPVSGQRYRLEVGGVAGSINYGSLLTDYRRYFFKNPVTAAVRGYHFGRYGSEEELDRLQPLYIGYPTLIRGYDINSFSLSECTPAAGAQLNCAEFDRLVGSKMAVANFEVRFPLFGVDRYGLISTGFLPLEIGAFFDAGMAWTGDDTPVFEFSRTSTERIPVFSAGANARVNLLGYMVVEAYYAYPFQRPEKGWHFGFNLAPGW